MKIYWASIEYKYDKSSSENLIGGFVYAFLKAKDEKIVFTRIEEELILNSKFPVEFEFIDIYDPKMEWEDKETTEHFRKLYEKAKTSSEIVFDDFYAYENEDEED